MVRIVHGTKSTPMVRNVYGTKSLVVPNEHIEYKLVSLTYKVLTTSQPDYLHNLISIQLGMTDYHNGPQLTAMDTDFD